MRITAIVGSQRRGNTYAMVESGCHALTDCEIELIHLKDLKIEKCDGCLICDSTGVCHYEDEMRNILEKLINSDGFILGTPARWNLLSGEIKVFLDRLNPLAVPELLKGKKAIIYAVGQSSGAASDSISAAANSVISFCNSAGIKVVDVVCAENCLEENDLISKFPAVLQDCKKAAFKLYESINEGL